MDTKPVLMDLWIFVVAVLLFGSGFWVGYNVQSKAIANSCDTVGGFYQSMPGGQLDAYTCARKAKP